uniref:cell wall hydrolase n=1 Tax=uncultured Caulobacter sp. TaxID=158749 RepID=UPI0025D50D11
MIRAAAFAVALASLALATAGPGARAQAVEGSVDLSRLRSLVDTPSARDAIARVTWAEAAGQGDSGLAGVVYTILNRLAAGSWGVSVEEVVNARAQFEPVLRAGGDWRSLPAVRPADRARIDTILNLALEGRLPDLTGGALYFQNPKIVAARAAAGA